MAKKFTPEMCADSAPTPTDQQVQSLLERMAEHAIALPDGTIVMALPEDLQADIAAFNAQFEDMEPEADGEESDPLEGDAELIGPCGLNSVPCRQLRTRKKGGAA